MSTVLPPQLAPMNPVLVEVWRGNEVESIHRGAACVVDAKGEIRALFERMRVSAESFGGLYPHAPQLADY